METNHINSNERAVAETGSGTRSRCSEILMGLPGPVAKSRTLTSSAKLVLARIYILSRRRGYCYMSQKTLAESIGMSERQVRRILRVLEAGGYVRYLQQCELHNARHRKVIYLEVCIRPGEASEAKPVCARALTPAAQGGADEAVPLEELCAVWNEESAGQLPPAQPRDYMADPALKAHLCHGWRDLCQSAEREGVPPLVFFRRLVERASRSSFLRGMRTGYHLTLPDFFSRSPSGERKWQRVAEGCYDDPTEKSEGPIAIKGQVSVEHTEWVKAG
ncbi:MAG: helix-turn-helix domain-containing protein [bacterium JZ-2024 1]